eukprot:2974827-Pyramimonas_sp.AAC.1
MGIPSRGRVGENPLRLGPALAVLEGGRPLVRGPPLLFLFLTILLARRGDMQPIAASLVNVRAWGKLEPS